MNALQILGDLKNIVIGGIYLMVLFFYIFAAKDKFELKNIGFIFLLTVIVIYLIFFN